MTSFAAFSSVSPDLGHSENGTRISHTVSEIFDLENSAETRFFFILIILIIKSLANFRSERLFELARAHFS